MNITVDRAVIEQALGALEATKWDGSPSFVKSAITALRTALEQPEQEPVATVTSETGADISMSWWHEPALQVGTKLYTAPPKREWVGLTDEEYTELWGMKPDLLNFFRKIEAKLKEKNT